MSEAYLTIDDAPSPKMREKLNILDKKNIPAIFFCEGRYIKERMDLVVEAIERDFIIGNHSYSHPHFSDIPFEEAKKEIKRTEKLIEKAYSKSERKRPGNFFRFPYGDRADGEKLQKLQNFLNQQGFTKPEFNKIKYRWYQENEEDKVDWFWTFDCMEWKLDGLDDILGRIEKRNPQDNIIENKELSKNMPTGLLTDSADIILIHDHAGTHGRNTHQYFKPIIDKLSQMNLNFQKPV